MRSPLEPADLGRLEAARIPESEALRQLELLRDPPPPARLVRPLTPGDGVLRLGETRLVELVEKGTEARDRGRVLKFVPASGAASRMFRSLAAARARGLAGDPRRLAAAAEGGDADARACLEFAAAIPRLALARPLAAELGLEPGELAERAREGLLEPILEALLEPGRLATAELPKALLPFHLDSSGRPVTALEEQIFEGLGYLADRDRRARYHFTVPPGRRALFEGALDGIRERLAAAGYELAVGFSEQSEATDTLALDDAGRPARDAAGRLLLRPAGHGALLPNLAGTGGDLVVIKNIDNVLPRDRHEEIARWKLALVGLAAETAERAAGWARELDAGRLSSAGLREAASWTEATFGRRLGAPDGDLAVRLAGALRRPLRVCGVVPSEGEPGGGPFWCRDRDGGESPQIVEFSQIDPERPEQMAIWGSSTHFNPVDLVVALRDGEGRPWDLDAFVDPASAFVTRKAEGGRSLRVLERPGLWNGAMAGWGSIFVEVPGTTFAPVKTVLDLARAAHATTPK